jgi:hypothetical protein
MFDSLSMREFVKTVTSLQVRIAYSTKQKTKGLLQTVKSQFL